MTGANNRLGQMQEKRLPLPAANQGLYTRHADRLRRCLCIRYLRQELANIITSSAIGSQPPPACFPVGFVLATRYFTSASARDELDALAEDEHHQGVTDQVADEHKHDESQQRCLQ